MPAGSVSGPSTIIMAMGAITAVSAALWGAIEESGVISEAVRNVAEGSEFYSGKLLPLNAMGALGGAFFSLIFDLYFARSNGGVNSWKLCLKFFAQPLLAFAFTPFVLRCLPIQWDDTYVVAVSFTIGACGIWIVKFVVDNGPPRVKRLWNLWWDTKEIEITNHNHPRENPPQDSQ